MKLSIAGDGLPNGSNVRANGSHNAAATEQGTADPNSGPQQEGGDASTANNLLGVPPEATAAQKGSKSSSSAAAGAAAGNHAINLTQDPADGFGSAIAADQHVAAAEALSEGPNTREGSPSYPVAVQPAQDIALKPSDNAGRRVPANGDSLSSSPPESLATAGIEAAAGDDGTIQVEVDRKPPPAPKKDPPAFVQTSALISNSCGYCGTRSTSGCWRRGWEIGNGKFINLCNKCGLRHKAGKLHSVPQPTPSPISRGAVAAGRVGNKNKSAAAAATHLTAADREAAAVSAAAAVAAAAGLPGSTASELLRSITLEQQQRQGGGSSNLSSLLAVAAANAAAGAAADDNCSSDQMVVDPQVWETETKIMAFLQGLGFGADHDINDCEGLPSNHNMIGSSSRCGSVPRRFSSNVGPYSDYAAADDLTAAAAAAGSNRSSLSGDFRSLIDGHPTDLILPDFAAAAAAAGSKGVDLRSLSNLSPDIMQILTGIATGDEPPAKRRRTKKIPGAFPVAAAPAAAAGSTRSRPVTAAGLDAEDSLAVGAADALLTLNRSSPSGSPPTGSPSMLPDAAAATADPFSPPITYDQAAATAAADKAAAEAERAAAAAATAAVDAAAGIAGWSSGPGNRSTVEAFLSGTFNPRSRVSGAAAAAAAAAAVPTGAAAAIDGGHLGGSNGDPGDHGAQLPSSLQQSCRQVTTSPNALRPGTHSLFPTTNSPSNNPPSRNNVTSPRNLIAPANNLVGNPASVVPRSWSQERVYQWLHSTGCNEAVRVFKDLDLDGTALAGLVRVAAADPARLHDVLKVDLGVQHVGLRLRLVENLVCLSMGEGL